MNPRLADGLNKSTNCVTAHGLVGSDTGHTGRHPHPIRTHSFA